MEFTDEPLYTVPPTAARRSALETANDMWTLSPPGLPAISELALVLLLSYEALHFLEHPARRRIYEHLLRLPGDHFRAIVRSLRLSIGVVRHHMAVLVRAGLVYEERVDGHVRYYPRGGGLTSQLAKLYRKHWKYRDLRFRVLLAVHGLREAQPAKVARAIGISRQLAAYHMSRLAKAGQLRVDAGTYRPR